MKLKSEVPYEELIEETGTWHKMYLSFKSTNFILNIRYNVYMPIYAFISFATV